MPPERKVEVIRSSELPSKDSKRASKLNPVEIKGGFFPGTGFYKPSDATIHVNFNNSAIDLYKSEDGIKNSLDFIPLSQHSNFKAEFDGSRIKATIYHELSHWLDDTFHNRYINKMIQKSTTFNNVSDAQTYVKQNEENVALTNYELNAQIHALKQLKRLNKDMWDLYDLRDVFQLSPPLQIIYKSLSPEGRKNWLKKLLKRMSREKILGAEMKNTKNLDML